MMDSRSARDAYQYGLDLMDMNQFDPAISNLSLAISRDPQFAEAYLARGRAFIKKQSYRQALDDLLRAAELGPDLPGLQMQLVAVYRALGQLREALEVCRQALQQQPDNAYYRRLHDEISAKTQSRTDC